MVTDAVYDSSVTMVEERVVLFRAHTFDEAMRAAEREALLYVHHRHVNPYGQKVITRYLGACEAFQLFDPPAAGSEVFSTTEILPKRISDKAIVNQRLGHSESVRDSKRRRNILNREFSGEVSQGA